MSHSTSTSSSTSASAAADEPSAKRMRLGTRSCAECRRRKVRCIVPPGARVCEGCSLHNVVCRSQGGAPSNQVDASTTPSFRTDEMNNRMLHQRIAQLENMMSRMVGSQRTDEGSSPTWATSTAPSPDRTILLDPRGSLDSDGDAQFDDAPLSGPLKDTMVLTPMGVAQSTGMESMVPSIYSERPSLPSARTLTALFTSTEKFWPTWPMCTFGIVEPQILVAGQQHRNINIIREAVRSNDTFMVSKAFLWLTLVLTHFPRYCVQELDMVQPLRKILEQYHRYATIVLGSAEDVGDNLHRLECYALQWRVCFDNGKPQKAWRILRHAITSAMQLGLHRLSVHKDKHKKALWNTFWQSERQISGLLGLPSCTTNNHPGTQLRDLSSMDSTEIAHHRLALIIGDTIQRDHTESKANYAVTVQLDEDLEEVKLLLPNLYRPFQADASFADSHCQLHARMILWNAQKFLHMPYMLKSTKEPRYHHSFTRTLEACRNIIETLASFRQVCKDFLCEVMDFHAFSAAVVLLIGILTHRTTTSGDNEKDWALITTASRCLRQTATVLECSVARQGADTLDVLIAAHNRTCTPQQDFTVKIPYFGSVKLRCKGSLESSRNTSPEEVVQSLRTNTASPNSTSFDHSISSTNDNLSQPYPSSASVEFSSNLFDPLLSNDFSFGDELTVDWFQGYGNEALSYDWMQEYPCYGTSTS